MAKEPGSPPVDHRALDTRIVHGSASHDADGGDGPWPSPAGAVNVPIYQSSVFGIETTGYEGLLYPRYNNLPDQRALAARLADLEGGDAAVATASGMAAISAGLLSVLGAGDHLLVTDGVYGGTQALIRDRFPKLGIEHTFVPASLSGDDRDAWAAALRPNTRAFYTETITNPLMRVPDLRGIAAFAREHDLAALVDNTFGTPLAFRPLDSGFDLSLHSATKYLNGHSDLVAGAVVGSSEAMAAVEKVMKTVGGSLDPHAAFLLMRGLKTLGLRFRRQCEVAGTLAAALEETAGVKRVVYPGLPSHPDHERASEVLDFYGGMLAFEIEGGWDAARRFLSRVRIAFHAPSLGGIETLVVSPARSSHAALSPEERERQGITDGMVRVSVGIEDPDDLIADFRQALER